MILPLAKAGSVNHKRRMPAAADAYTIHCPVTIHRPHIQISRELSRGSPWSREDVAIVRRKKKLLSPEMSATQSEYDLGVTLSIPSLDPLSNPLFSHFLFDQHLGSLLFQCRHLAGLISGLGEEIFPLERPFGCSIYVPEPSFRFLGF